MKRARNSTPEVEAFLRDRLVNNERRGSDAKESAVIKRLLSMPEALAPVYGEIVKRAGPGWKHVVDQVLVVATNWTPERARAMRRSLKDLKDTNQRIGDLARKLAALIEKREDLSEKSSLDGYDDLHVIDWIAAAARRSEGRTRTLFEWHVKDQLLRLRSQFDYKYWPGQAAVLRALEAFATEHEIRAAEPLAGAAIESRQGSARDFTRVLDKALALLSHSNTIPSDFKISPKSLAELATYALDLPPGQLTPENVKSSRHAR